MNDIINEIETELFALQDEKYRDFNASLVPTLDKNSFIGVRSPELRRLAKKYTKDEIIDILVMGESYSDHPIAKSILRLKDTDIDSSKVKNFKEAAADFCCGLFSCWFAELILITNKTIDKKSSHNPYKAVETATRLCSIFCIVFNWCLV